MRTLVLACERDNSRSRSQHNKEVKITEHTQLEETCSDFIDNIHHDNSISHVNQVLISILWLHRVLNTVFCPGNHSPCPDLLYTQQCIQFTSRRSCLTNLKNSTKTGRSSFYHTCLICNMLCLQSQLLLHAHMLTREDVLQTKLNYVQS